MHKKGFTLLELLMAAAIISALAVVATATYRSKMIDGYAADAKNQARTVAMAVRLFELEYSVKVAGESEIPDAPQTIADSCDPSDPDFGRNGSASELVACGFLENRAWGAKYFHLEIVEGDPTRVCVVGPTGSSLPTRYRGTFVCINSVTGEEENP